MEYGFVMHLHIMAGAVALFSFWTTALARKGGKVHRTAGKVYLVALLLIIVTVIPMIAINIQHDEYSVALGLAFLIVMTFAAAWMAKHSIEYKRRLAGYKGYPFRVLATVLTLFGFLILTISIRGGSFLYAFFACTGITLAGSMWYVVIAKKVGPNWYLSQHLNGVALLFAATHGSFLRFGLTKLIPVIPDTQEFNTFSQISVILLGLLLRLTLGERFLKTRSAPLSNPTVSLPTQSSLR
jgi:uncharacterized membrane protein YjgN (DUF898 family)